MDDTPQRRTRRGRTRADTVLRWLGWVAHAGLGVFPTSASGLLAPAWAVAVIVAAWVLLAVLAWSVGRRRPRLTPAVPLAYLVGWFAFIMAGDALLGWTA